MDLIIRRVKDIYGSDIKLYNISESTCNEIIEGLKEKGYSKIKEKSENSIVLKNPESIQRDQYSIEKVNRYVIHFFSSKKDNVKSENFESKEELEDFLKKYYLKHIKLGFAVKKEKERVYIMDECYNLEEHLKIVCV